MKFVSSVEIGNIFEVPNHKVMSYIRDMGVPYNQGVYMHPKTGKQKHRCLEITTADAMRLVRKHFSHWELLAPKDWLDQGGYAVSVNEAPKAKPALSLDVVASADPGMLMTSLEIAEMLGSRHEDVKRSINRLVDTLSISLPPTACVRVKRDRRDEEVSVYVFSGEQGKRDSIIVVAQLSPQFTAKLVDRWQELEKAVKGTQLALPNFTDPVAAAQAWIASYQAQQKAEAEAAKQLLIAQEKTKALEEAAVVVDAFNRLADVGDSFTVSKAAKDLQMQPLDLFKYLESIGWIYRRQVGGSWIAKQVQINSGYLIHKMSYDPAGQSYPPQVRVTPKGLKRIARLRGVDLEFTPKGE